jgi:hypothetical protein
MLDLDELLDNLSIIMDGSLAHDHRRITVQAMTFGKARIIIGRPLPHTDIIFDQEDGWCYLSHKAALNALKAWNPEKDKEPDGWSRNLSTMRYRVDGRTDLEYVKNPLGDSLEAQVAYALSVAHGETRVIKELKQARAGDVFPFGTQRFVVVSESPACPHDPKCQPIDMVYQRFDRWVVMSMERFLTITVDDVLRRLISDNGKPWEVRHPGYLAELYGMIVARSC